MGEMGRKHERGVVWMVWKWRGEGEERHWKMEWVGWVGWVGGKVHDTGPTRIVEVGSHRLHIRGVGR